jgi:hypothetical protein
MKKIKSARKQMRDEYDFSQGARGKYAGRYAQGDEWRCLGARCRQGVLQFESRERFAAGNHPSASTGAGEVSLRYFGAAMLLIIKR